MRAYYNDPEGYRVRGDTEIEENRQMRMSSQLRAYDEDPYGYKRPGLEIHDLDDLEEIDQVVELDIFGREKLASSASGKPNSDDLNYSMTFKQQNANANAVEEQNDAASRRRTTVTSKLPPSCVNANEIKRVTVISRLSRGGSVVSQKLRPTLIANDYYYQTLEDVIEANGVRKVTLITKKENGEVISQQPIKLSQLGSFHHSLVVYPRPANGSAREARATTDVSLVVRNEKGETLAVTPVPVCAEQAESIRGVFAPNGDRRSTITVSRTARNGTLTTHRLRPILIGNEYYQQRIELAIDELGNRKLTVSTINENGEVVSTSRANPNLTGDAYVCYTTDEHVDELGTRSVTLNTVNNKGQLLLHQSLTTNMESFLKDRHAISVLEEVEDAFGRRTLTLISRNQTAASHVQINKQFRPTILGEHYYFELVEEAVDAEGRRKVTVIAKQNRGDTIAHRSVSVRPEQSMQDNVFEDFEREIEQTIEKELPDNPVIPLRPVQGDYTLEIVEERATMGGERTVTVAAKDQRGKTLASRAFKSSASVVVGEPAFEVVLNQLEEEMAEQFQSVLRQKSILASKVSRAPRFSTKITRSQAGQPLDESQWNSITRDLKPADQSDAATPFEPQNVYYRKLLAQLEASSGVSRGSLPAPPADARLAGAPAKPKSNTTAGVVGRPLSETMVRPSRGRSPSLYDKNKSTLDIKQELKKESDVRAPAESASQQQNVFDLDDDLAASRESEESRQQFYGQFQREPSSQCVRRSAFDFQPVQEAERHGSAEDC